MSKSALARSLGVLAASLAVAGLATPSALANTPATGLGINGWYLFWQMPQSKWDAQLSSMQADGVKVVRTDALWSSAEPNAPVNGVHAYNWATLDAIAGALARHGMQWLPIIDYSAPWTESVAGDLQSPPLDTGSYAAYAAAVVRRYGPNGSFWGANPSLTPRPVTAVEIWNEENLAETWGGNVDASQYAPLYAAARSAVHSASASVQAIVGGLGQPAATYLKQMYATLGGPGHIDAVSDHPYGSDPGAVEYAIRSLRNAMDAEGDTNVPIDVTEFGWPTNGTASWIPTLTDAQRATDITAVVDTVGKSDCNVERILPYAWNTAQASTTNVDDWFGVANLDGSATATSSALAREYAALEAAAPTASAGNSMCGRPLTLQLASVPAQQGSTANMCVRATALSWSSAGWATVGIIGAVVRFTAPSLISLTTNASGQATACWKEPAGHSVGVSATATQQSFSQAPSASLTVTVSSTTTTTTTASKL